MTQGLEHTQRADVSLDGRGHRLTCIPVDDVVVCVLNRRAESDPEKWQLLTAREQTVLSLLAIGDETPAVARKLNISESTVRTHVEKMRTKLGVGTRAALVALGFRLGYLS
jgi:DNA-binding NarL/FixJ family response regulator